MPRNIDSDIQIGRRLRLRDLHLFLTVVQEGSMAKAASRLGISQPAVSEVIAALEDALGVRLFDRNTRGVEPTVYGRALLKRGRAAFDELRQGIRDIESLSDPAGGELWIGCAPAPVVAIMPPIVQQFSQQYPRVVLHIDEVPSPRQELTGLRERKYDLIVGRWMVSHHEPGDDLNVDLLLDDPLVIAVGKQSPWAKRHKVNLAELLNERWIVGPPTTWAYDAMKECFRAGGFHLPKASVVSVSAHIRAHMLANGPFVCAVSKSLANWYSLKVLPVALPAQTQPVAIITLKNRMLTPVTQLFIDCAHEVAKTLV